MALGQLDLTSLETSEYGGRSRPVPAGTRRAAEPKGSGHPAPARQASTGDSPSPTSEIWQVSSDEDARDRTDDDSAIARGSRSELT